MAGPLEGIRVLDLTQVLFGPFATMLLNDLGAEVIKIERPEVGDIARGNGPVVRGQSTYFLSLNRGKKSVTLNLATEQGKDILLKLVKNVDVLVQNFKPGTMENLGLSYEKLGEHGNAISELVASKSLNPDSWKVHANLARAALNAGELEKALPWAQEAVDLDRNSETLNVLGLVWMALSSGHGDRALRWPRPGEAAPGTVEAQICGAGGLPGRSGGLGLESGHLRSPHRPHAGAHPEPPAQPGLGAHPFGVLPLSGGAPPRTPGGL